MVSTNVGDYTLETHLSRLNVYLFIYLFRIRVFLFILPSSCRPNYTFVYRSLSLRTLTRRRLNRHILVDFGFVYTYPVVVLRPCKSRVTLTLLVKDLPLPLTTTILVFLVEVQHIPRPFRKVGVGCTVHQSIDDEKVDLFLLTEEETSLH